MTRDSVHEQSKCSAFNSQCVALQCTNLVDFRCSQAQSQAPLTTRDRERAQKKSTAYFPFDGLLDAREVEVSERQSLWPLALDSTRQDCPSGVSISFAFRFPTKTAFLKAYSKAETEQTTRSSRTRKVESLLAALRIVGEHSKEGDLSLSLSLLVLNSTVLVLTDDPFGRRP